MKKEEKEAHRKTTKHIIQEAINILFKTTPIITVLRRKNLAPPFCLVVHRNIILCVASLYFLQSGSSKKKSHRIHR